VPWIRDTGLKNIRVQEPDKNIPDLISKSLIMFWVKNTQFLVRIRCLFDLGFGMGNIRIRDEHPGSATLQIEYEKIIFK
jgi:hypothetical protein